VRIAGIDLSTHAVDIVTVPAWDDGEPVWHRYELTGPDAWERARSVRDAMPPRTSDLWDEVLAFGVENPQARGPAAQNISVLHRVLGGVLACLPPKTLVHPWQPASWRKACGMAGNTSKDDVRVWAALQLGPKPEYTGAIWPQDAVDAFAIALATRAVLRTGQAKVA
jgi:hypothetical protein